jgi:hypothetical protein
LQPSISDNQPIQKKAQDFLSGLSDPIWQLASCARSEDPDAGNGKDSTPFRY